ncbi:MAG: DegT/DnrJ/EryC1/StrS family aminotransferase [Candidatus Peribacteria bacterium]|nr:DegT/DnrJ/EryC1/StrS family aminotransferase [Candidatus Peribacteria bacterium]
MPNSLAKLALNDLENIEEYNKHRRKIAKFYDKNLNSKYFEIAFKEDKNENINYFRYAIIFKKEDIATDFFKYMRKN